jgi:hypothetical protein
MSINPQLDEDNQLGLKMTVAGDSRDRAIELVRRMEESRRFAQTNIIAENAKGATSGDTEQFDIVATYIPEPMAPAAASRTPDTRSKREAKPKMEAKPKPLSPKGIQH